MDFGLAIVDRLSQGRFALRANVITITGVAASEADYLAINKVMAQGAPSGLVLARSELLAPKADKFQWAAEKSSSGTLSLSGMVPNPETRATLLEAAGSSVLPTLSYASGAPDNFESSALLGLQLLRNMASGKATLEGSAWTLTGTPASESARKSIEDDFAGQGLAAAGWSMALGETSVTTAVEPAALDLEYAFSAVKSSNDDVIFSGQLPADPALRFFKAITNGNVDAVSIAPGAPPDFIMQAEAGIRALLLLEEGALEFRAGKWSLSGAASDDTARVNALAALAPAGRDAWTTDISLPAQPAPEPAPEPVPEQVASAAAQPAPKVQGAPEMAACSTPLADFSARNAILFRSGAAIITPQSAPALDELAANLNACPDTIVQVEGHTDADGDDQLNLALSVARAEAVISALVERGIKAERLYALGFGETSPISDNDTAEGKSLNRRIVVKIAQP